MDNDKNIIVADSLAGWDLYTREHYLAHALCLGGSCRFLFNGNEFALATGDVMIVRNGSLVEHWAPSEDFRVKVIYVAFGFIELCTPQSNYGMKGQLSLFLNPVMHLLPHQQEICRKDFESVECRLRNKGHHFYREMQANAVQMMILDFFDFHSHLYGDEDISTQNASLMSRFFNMLEEGTYRTHREVSFFADKLCVTPKYLSEVCKKVSGYAANYWINRYTALDIARQLRDKSRSLSDISESFCFSSAAYFSRYVLQHLGVKPSDYREP